MTDAYDDWAEMRVRAGSHPEDHLLRRMEERLRPEALVCLLERHAGLDNNEEPIHLDAVEVAAFLSDLDEVRKPPAPAPSELLRTASDLVQKMKGLNWTGDHLYSDALDDVSELLSHISKGGKGLPQFQRFLCPSMFRMRKNKSVSYVRCELRLPHEGNHQAAMGSITWADEQAVDPPKVYETQCSSVWMDEKCVLPAGHEGHHRNEGGSTSSASWPDSYATGGAAADTLKCAAFRTTAGLTLRCDLPAGHIGDHNDGGQMGQWS